VPETSIDPHHTALLVMDYQNGLIGSLPNSENLLTRAREAIDLVRRHDGHIGFVRIGFESGEFTQIPAHSPMAAVVTPERHESLHSEAPTTQIHDRLAPEPGDITVRKIRIGAFSTTDLDQHLADREITTLILAGISTSGVVLSTLRDAIDRDYRIVVLSDACADPDPETHSFLTERIFPRHALVMTTAELVTLVESTPTPTP
jgi:nicotinamidase-related amidase